MFRTLLSLSMGGALLLSGCGYTNFTDRRVNPIVEDYITDNAFNGGVYGVLTTSPARRSILVNLGTPGAENYQDVCAEPPADVVEAYRSEVRASAEAKADVPGKGSAEFKGEFERSLATAALALTRRSQGLQFARDQMFYLCIDRMNGVIGDAEYQRYRSELIILAAGLIEKEISSLPAALGQVSAIAATANQKPAAK